MSKVYRQYEPGDGWCLARPANNPVMHGPVVIGWYRRKREARRALRRMVRPHDFSMMSKVELDEAWLPTIGGQLLAKDERWTP